MDLLIGADPEFFVKKDGKFVSAHGLVEGTKKEPLKVKGGAVQVDGMALEINVDPAKDFKGFEGNFQSVMGEIRKMVGPEYEFAFVPVADFDEEYIKNQPEEARRLGCDPDFNAWTGRPNNPPDAAKNFRTASGHWHLGWTENEDVKNPEHIDACEMMTRQLDASIGLMSVIYDEDTRRRELYGKAGAYRPKPYGVEYRVLSNFWLGNYDYRKELFKNIGVAFNRLIEGNDFSQNFNKGNLEKYINSGSINWAFEGLGYIGMRSASIITAYNNRKYISTEPVKKRARKIAADPQIIAGFGARNIVVDDEINIAPGGIAMARNQDWIVDGQAWRPVAPPAPPVVPLMDIEDNRNDLEVEAFLDRLLNNGGQNA